PVWLEAGGVRTDQTSGIAFVRRSGTQLTFLACDDVGAIHRLQLDEADKKRGTKRTTGDGWMTISPIAIPDPIKERLGTGPAKLDLEEIAVHGQGILLSVEGNRTDEEEVTNPRAHEGRIGLFFIELNAPPATATTVAAAHPIPILNIDWPAPLDPPAQRPELTALPVAGMAPNRSFEGVAYGSVPGTDNGGQPTSFSVFYLAPEEPYPADDLIPQAWRGALPIYRVVLAQVPVIRPQVLPAAVGLASVTGMALTPDQSRLFLVDRNRQRIHRCTLNAAGDIVTVETAPLDLRGPSGERYLVPSLESITVDDRGVLWAVVDPWQYRAIPEQGKPLSRAELDRYQALVP
ncbi:MAG TPA: hypothetical protein VEI97_05250, partial [bacterium]|nr:hypothetical protein [bacterium]